MKIKALALVFACAALVFVGAVGVSFGLLGILGIPTASALTWDFSQPPNTADGTSKMFDTTPPTGTMLTAAGFSSTAALAARVPDFPLFTKSAGVGEMGIGLTNDGVGNVLLSTISAVPVPGPTMGAGLPGLVIACGALIALARRRRQRIA